MTCVTWLVTRVTWLTTCVIFFGTFRWHRGAHMCDVSHFMRDMTRDMCDRFYHVLVASGHSIATDPRRSYFLVIWMPQLYDWNATNWLTYWCQLYEQCGLSIGGVNTASWSVTVCVAVCVAVSVAGYEQGGAGGRVYERYRLPQCRVYVYTCACIYVYMYVYIYIYIHTYIYTHVYIHTHIHSCTYTHVYIHIEIYVCT